MISAAVLVLTEGESVRVTHTLTVPLLSDTLSAEGRDTSASVRKCNTSQGWN